MGVSGTGSTLGRGSLLVALADLFVSSLTAAGAIRLLLTFRSASAELYHARGALIKLIFVTFVSIEYFSWALLSACTIIILLSIILIAATIAKKSWLVNVWLWINYVYMGLMASVSVLSLLTDFFLLASLFIIPVILRAFQCWVVKEFHWKILEMRASPPVRISRAHREYQKDTKIMLP